MFFIDNDILLAENKPNDKGDYLMKKIAKLSILSLLVFVLSSCGFLDFLSTVPSSSNSSGGSSNLNDSSNVSNESPDESQTSSSHKHSFADSWAYDSEWHWHESTCGHEVTSDKAAHSFTSVVTDPTYESGGYTTYTCSVCGFSYTGDETDKLEHNYSADWSYDTKSHWHACVDAGYEELKSDEEAHEFIKDVTDPTYESGGYTTYVCSVCGYTYIGDETSPLTINITWKNYDGSILKVTPASYGELPIYDGEVPTRSDGEYVFTGWSSEIGYAYESKTYVAQFEKTDDVFSFVLSDSGDSYLLDVYKRRTSDIAYLSIPSTYKGLPVISVGHSGSNAFLNCDSIVDVYIPDSVTTLASFAFNNCPLLRRVIIGKDSELETIQYQAFFDCNHLETIYIPKSVTGVGSQAFVSSTSLKIYCGAPSNPSGWASNWNNNDCPVMWNCLGQGMVNNGLCYGVCEDESGNAFASIGGYIGTSRDVIIPSSVMVDGSDILVTEIYQKAFYGSSCYTFAIPDTVIAIGDYAFYDCWGLREAVIGENSGLVSVGTYAFYDSGWFKSFYLPAGVTTIEEYAFSECQSLTLYCAASAKPSGWSNRWNIDNRPVVWNSYFGVNGDAPEGFLYGICKDADGDLYATLTGYSGDSLELVIPSSIVFDGADIPVTAIGDDAFRNYDSLTSVYIPNGIITVGDTAFSGCPSLVIYCEDSSAPSGWSSTWSSNRPVVWSSYCGVNGVTEDYIRYGVSIDENGEKYVTITGCSREEQSRLHIPSTIEVEGEALPVTKIANRAFAARSISTDSLEIPDSVTSIGDYAFYDCTFSRDRVSFGEQSELTEIGDSAFERSSISSITIPDGVTSIGDSAFSGCGNLGYVSIGDDSALNSIGSEVFSECGLLTSFTIPDGVVSIGARAFEDCASLAEININSSCRLSAIEEETFYKCRSLTSFEIPDGVTFIGERAFIYSTSLSLVTIPSGVATIGREAFDNCWMLKKVSFGENSCLTSIEYGTFSSCSLSSISLPNGLVSIGNYAFENCDDLVYINIPSSVTSIGEYAFDGCVSLTDLHFYDSSCLSEVGSYAFNNCDSLTSIDIPVGVESIGSNAFELCVKLKKVTIKDNAELTDIGDYAFSDCIVLEKVTVGRNSKVNAIGSYAFYRCRFLKSIFIPKTVREIGIYAFTGCNNLTIYCEAASKPANWDSEWNDGFAGDIPVVWGTTYNEYLKVA